MATFIMFGQYSGDAIKGIAADRTAKAEELIGKYGGKVEAMYALLGADDLVFVVDLPGTKEAMKASVALAESTGIAFRTCPAVSVSDFDGIMNDR